MNELKPYPVLNIGPVIAGSGILGYASKKYRHGITDIHIQYKRNLIDRRCNITSNETAMLPLHAKRIDGRQFVPKENSIFFVIGIALFAIALATGVQGMYTFTKRKNGWKSRVRTKP